MNPTLPSRSVIFYGLSCFIENLKGTYRYGRGWITKAPEHYGFIWNFQGADGDEMDCYIGEHMWSGRVFVVDQNIIGSDEFDEHKCMLGFSGQKEALRCYMDGHNRARQIFRGITEMSVFDFIHWLKFGDHTVPVSG